MKKSPIKIVQGFKCEVDHSEYIISHKNESQDQFVWLNKKIK